MASRRGQLIDGVLLLDKPEGWSSNQALQRAKRVVDARKAGHTGTLDPFATGLLVCCLGRATRLSGQLLDSDKTYVATLTLGQETDSGDPTGQVIQTAPAGFDGITESQLHAVLPGFRGEIQQIPPMHSALKRDGKPLYEYARKGIVLERPPRTVQIHELEVVSMTPRTIEILVRCSKGTYIRTLAADIGRQLGCGAFLSALRRTEVGPFHLRQAIGLEALEGLEAPVSAVIPMSALPDGLRPDTL